LVQPKRATGTPVLPAAGVTATGAPGFYTVGDVANLYNINPLYDAGIDGTGHTIGIATLANFIPDDAYTYWDEIGLPVAPDRITQIHVDGGGELSSPAGSGETSLDVEQSGGLAPGAKIIATARHHGGRRLVLRRRARLRQRRRPRRARRREPVEGDRARRSLPAVGAAILADADSGAERLSRRSTLGET
jgi:hypothetical protein